MKSMKTFEPEAKEPAPQHQESQPGIEAVMEPVPQTRPSEPRSGKLEGKVALITGGDSGIGKAVALLFAREGADISIIYFDEEEDAVQTEKEIKDYGREVIKLKGDITIKKFCDGAVEQTIARFGQLDILINNAGVQFPHAQPEEIDIEQLIRTFETNVFSAFYFTLSALPYMKKGSCIVNTTSVTAYKGSRHLIDYSATKGALVSFTRSLSAALANRSAVAPAPVWTPLIPSSFSESEVASFGKDVPLGRAAQPAEIAPCYLFLVSGDAGYITGQVLHPNGGEIVNW